MNAIQRTVEIDPSRRVLTLERPLPVSIPCGTAQINITLVIPEPKTAAPRETARAKLERLRGSLSPSAFGGLDGAAYQRKVRDEWNA